MNKSPQLIDILGRNLTDLEEKKAPKEIFTVGSVPPNKKRISVIGSRDATITAISHTKSLVKELVSRDSVIVAGLAKGIDYTAHTSAIEYNGHTIAVVGTPLNKCYPAEHIRLLNIIKQKYMVISQFPEDHITTKSDFVLRNFTMALISDATILVQARYGSGSLYVANEMLRLGKPVYMSRFVEDRVSKELSKKGAKYINNNYDIDMLYYDMNT